MSKLYAARYDENDYAGSAPVESFGEVADLGIRWSLPGGLKRMEVAVRAGSEFDAYDRYNNHLGQTIAIYDSFADRYLAGQIYEVVPDGRHVVYICSGPQKRLNDDVYLAADFPGSGNTDAIIKDILTDRCPTISSDQGNIESTSIDIGAWEPSVLTVGANKYAGSAILELAEMGNSSAALTDFYLVDRSFGGVQLQKPLAYLAARSTTAAPDWQFSKHDLAAGGLTLSRNIWNLTRTIHIGAMRLGGTHTAAGNNANLIDAAAGFSNKVAPGDRVINITQSRLFTVETVDSDIQLTFQPPGHVADWDTNDTYSISLTRPTYQTATSTETDLWSRILFDIRAEMDSTQADNYGDALLALYEKPVQQQAFVLGSPAIKDGNGARWPLWRPLMGNSFYFRVDDLFPEAALFSTSDDRLQAFIVVAMDYTYRDNRLRIVPSTGDSRLDVLLAQALSEKKLIGEIISTAQARRYKRGGKIAPDDSNFSPTAPSFVPATSEGSASGSGGGRGRGRGRGR